MPSNHLQIVIMAGGAGKRLWPLGRKDRPKPFLKLLSDATLITRTYERLIRRFPKEYISIAVTHPFQDLVKELFPDVRIFVEPIARDTAAAMAYVSCALLSEEPTTPLLFVPADQSIENEDRFLDCLEAVSELVRETGNLVDIGIRPRSPATTLGYVNIGKRRPELEARGIPVYEFLGQVEKPNAARAVEFLASGDYLWHASFFSWTPEKWIAAFERYTPELLALIRAARAAEETGDHHAARVFFEKIPPCSIDYAVAEKIDPQSVLIVEGDFGWDDVGSWDSVYHALGADADEQGNVVVRGRAIMRETSNSLVMSTADRVIGVVGATDMIIIDTPDGLLVCAQKHAQKVKELYDILSREFPEAV